MREVHVRTGNGRFRQEIDVSGITLVSDEPAALGGDDAGLAPHELVLAGLGSCTSMTVKMYAERKGWPLLSVEVRLTGEHDEGAYVITRRIELHGDLDAEQRARLIEIANKCPVHRTLSGPIRIDTRDETKANA